MKKISKQFLLLTFILGYLCFGIIAYSNIIFSNIFYSPIYLLLLILGSLSPFISALIVFVLNKDRLGGIEGFINNFTVIKNRNNFLLIIVFTLFHYGLGAIFKNIYLYENIGKYPLYLPIMVLLIGSQEIGWRRIVYLSFEEEKGYIKSVIITGLFWSLWFLPLIFIKGFIVLPQFFTQFAAYLVGISALLTSLYKSSGSILYCTLLSGLIFAMAPILAFKQNFTLVGIAILEIVIGNIFRDKE